MTLETFLETFVSYSQSLKILDVLDNTFLETRASTTEALLYSPFLKCEVVQVQSGQTPNVLVIFVGQLKQAVANKKILQAA